MKPPVLWAIISVLVLIIIVIFGYLALRLHVSHANSRRSLQVAILAETLAALVNGRVTSVARAEKLLPEMSHSAQVRKLVAPQDCWATDDEGGWVDPDGHPFRVRFYMQGQVPTVYVQTAGADGIFDTTDDYNAERFFTLKTGY